jgi:hypothetical protein
MEWRETVTMNFFPRTIAGQPSSSRDQTKSRGARNREASNQGSHEAAPIADSDPIVLTGLSSDGKGRHVGGLFVYFLRSAAKNLVASAFAS